MSSAGSRAPWPALLPAHVQARILAHLCAPDGAPGPRVELSLRHGEALTAPLPSPLLAPALASRALAAAAARLLAGRAAFLTHCNTAASLPAWIDAFAPFVRAVSVADTACPWYMERLPAVLDAQRLLLVAEYQSYSLRLFRALARNVVALEVLDLQDVVFLDFDGEGDHFMAGFCAALESSSPTLRELGLPIFPNSDICENALAMSQLPKLDVLSVRSWPFRLVNESNPLPPPVIRVLRAVDGHADRSRNLTTLRELRFLDIHSLGYRYFTEAERHSSVVRSIKTLRIAWRSDAFLWDGSHRVLSLFNNLERLFWNFVPGSAAFFFDKLCTNVSQVHSNDIWWREMSAHADLADYANPICFFFGERPSRCGYGSGAIASLCAGPMPATYLANVMTHCPSLQNLSVNVTRDNIRAIRKLVAKCQQLKRLELLLDEVREGRPGRPEIQDWHRISRVVPNSHNSLRQVAIQSPKGLSWPLHNIDPVFACFETVTKALGARAKSLTFRVEFRIGRATKIIERVCDLLNVCLRHTPVLESLHISPRLSKLDSCDYSTGHANELARRLISMDSRLVRELKSLRNLDIGVPPWLLLLVNRMDDAVETDTFSETERTTSSTQTAST